MKDEDLKLEEIEASHTLGGIGDVTRKEGRGCDNRSHPAITW